MGGECRDAITARFC
jgi:hypothetical protein